MSNENKKNQPEKTPQGKTGAQLVAHLRAEGTGKDKLSKIEQHLIRVPDISGKDMIRWMRDNELPPGTMQKACIFVFDAPVDPESLRDDEADDKIRELSKQVVELDSKLKFANGNIGRLNQAMQIRDNEIKALKGTIETLEQQLKTLGETPVSKAKPEKELAGVA